MAEIEPSLLRQFVLFQDLTDAELAKVASVGRERKFPKRHTIFLEGEKGNYIVLILSGIVKISRSASDGRVKTLALLRAPDFFGEMAIFLQGHERSATAEALTDLSVITIGQEDFEKLLQDYTGISVSIIRTLAQRLLAMNQQAKTLALGEGKSKIADLLLWLKDDFSKDGGPPIVIPLTHQDLADLAGFSRETTTRLLNSMEGEGVVRLKSKQIELADLAALKKLAT